MIVDAMWEAALRKSVREQVTKFNPNHDELGRFTTGGVSSAVADSIIARVKANGGLSVKILTGEEPTDGFMVAQQGHNQEIKEEEFFDAKKGRAALSAYLKAKKLVFGKDQYLGLWWNKDKKEISLDVVDKIKTRSQATKAGRERNQQAIWDVKNQEEINTGGTGDRTTEPTLASSETSKAFGGDDGSGDRGVRVPSLGKFRTGKQRVVQQTIRAKVFKVSFGGNASEAGRYAAQQRWKNHKKAEKPAPKKAVSSAREIADRIRTAQKSVADAGFKVEGRQVTDSGDYQWYAERMKDKAEETFIKTHAFAYPNHANTLLDDHERGRNPSDTDTLPSLPERFRLGSLMIKKALTVNNAFQSDGIVTVMNGDVVAAAGSYRLFPKRSTPVLLFDYAGSHGVVKGAGSALFAKVVVVAYRKKMDIVLGALKDSVPFWESQGFKNDGFNSDRGVFNMVLSRERVVELAEEIYRD